MKSTVPVIDPDTKTLMRERLLNDYIRIAVMVYVHGDQFERRLTRFEG